MFLPLLLAAKTTQFSIFFLAVPGGVEKRYSCCERIVGSAGCQNAKVGVMFSEGLYNAVSKFCFLCPFDLKLGHGFL